MSVEPHMFIRGAGTSQITPWGFSLGGCCVVAVRALYCRTDGGGINAVSGITKFECQVDGDWVEVPLAINGSSSPVCSDAWVTVLLPVNYNGMVRVSYMVFPPDPDPEDEETPPAAEESCEGTINLTGRVQALLLVCAHKYHGAADVIHLIDVEVSRTPIGSAVILNASGTSYVTIGSTPSRAAFANGSVLEPNISLDMADGEQVTAVPIEQYTADRNAPPPGGTLPTEPNTIWIVVNNAGYGAVSGGPQVALPTGSVIFVYTATFRPSLGLGGGFFRLDVPARFITGGHPYPSFPGRDFWRPWLEEE